MRPAKHTSSLLVAAVVWAATVPTALGAEPTDSPKPATTAEPEPETPVQSEPTKPVPDWRFEFHGAAHYRFRQLSELATDDLGTPHGVGSVGWMRLRLASTLAFRDVGALAADLRILEGQVHGDSSAFGGDEVTYGPTRVGDQVLLRELHLSLNTPVGLIRVGRQTEDWGMGVLVSSGRGTGLFNDTAGGDFYDRLLFVTHPAAAFTDDRAAEALELSLAADFVALDEQVDRGAGDVAWQVVGTLAWREPDVEAGMYVAYRDLKREDGERTQRVATDLYGRWATAISDVYRLQLQLELAILDGDTELSQPFGAPVAADVLQIGAVLKAEVERDDDGLAASLEVGYASRDGAPLDADLRNMRFDPGYSVGMILFEELLNVTSARGAVRAADPALGVPGVERIPTGGTVTSAVYLYPQGIIRTWDRRLEGAFAVLVAFAGGAVADPYQTAVAGGTPRNPWRKADATGLLGTELDLGVRVIFEEIRDIFTARFGLAGAVFIPGPALGAGEGGEELDPVFKWRLLVDLEW